MSGITNKIDTQNSKAQQCQLKVNVKWRTKAKFHFQHRTLSKIQINKLQKSNNNHNVKTANAVRLRVLVCLLFNAKAFKPAKMLY